MSKEQEGTIRGLNHSRKRMLSAIEGLNEVQASSIAVVGEWTVKDLLGHITSWDTTLLHPLRLFHAGSDFTIEPIDDYHTWNDKQAAYRSKQTYSKTFQEFEDIRSALIRRYKKLPESILSQLFTAPWGDICTISKMLAGLAWHETEHAKEISHWSKRVILEI